MGKARISSLPPHSQQPLPVSFMLVPSLQIPAHSSGNAVESQKCPSANSFGGYATDQPSISELKPQPICFAGAANARVLAVNLHKVLGLCGNLTRQTWQRARWHPAVSSGKRLEVAIRTLSAMRWHRTSFSTSSCKTSGESQSGEGLQRYVPEHGRAFTGIL